jgi:hypothetical protein
MNMIKYLFYIILFADINQAYHLVPCIYNRRYRDIRTLGVLRKNCRYIKNATDYALELLIIIDILLPKKKTDKDSSK